MKENEMIFAISEDGVLTKYEEPYTSIECKTEQDYNRLLELLEKGKRAELDSKDMGSVSDGYHTFDELYYHRMVLFSIICNTYKDKAWKSWKHHDGTMYDNYFIVGIDTPQGQYSYHYHYDNWEMFKVKELKNAPLYDGHLPSDIFRLYSLL